jgi:hypothetical protein
VNKPAPYDLIKVLTSLDASRSIGGSSSVERGPIAGDVGTVLEVWSSPDGSSVFMAECVNREGYTVWLCEFEEHEVELLQKV